LPPSDASLALSRTVDFGSVATMEVFRSRCRQQSIEAMVHGKLVSAVLWLVTCFAWVVVDNIFRLDCHEYDISIVLSRTRDFGCPIANGAFRLCCHDSGVSTALSRTRCFGRVVTTVGFPRGAINNVVRLHDCELHVAAALPPMRCFARVALNTVFRLCSQDADAPVAPSRRMI
jgi:hypothetical protein